MLVADVAGRRLALRSADVQEVQEAVQLSPLPGAPSPVEGLVDLRGRVVAVIDARRLLGVEPRPIRLSDRLVFIRGAGRLVALRVDHVDDLATARVADVSEAASSSALRLRAAGVARLRDGLVVVHDTNALLTADESELLDAAIVLAESGGAGADDV